MPSREGERAALSGERQRYRERAVGHQAEEEDGERGGECDDDNAEKKEVATMSSRFFRDFHFIATVHLDLVTE